MAEEKALKYYPAEEEAQMKKVGSKIPIPKDAKLLLLHGLCASHWRNGANRRLTFKL